MASWLFDERRLLGATGDHLEEQLRRGVGMTT